MFDLATNWFLKQLLKSSVSHNASEIIPICWFGFQETFPIINNVAYFVLISLKNNILRGSVFTDLFVCVCVSPTIL